MHLKYLSMRKINIYMHFVHKRIDTTDRSKEKIVKVIYWFRKNLTENKRSYYTDMYS